MPETAILGIFNESVTDENKYLLNHILLMFKL